MASHTDKQYLDLDVGSYDDFPAEVECRKTALVVTRKEHLCFGFGRGGQHKIPTGTRVIKESGKCEGDFRTCYLCLPCADRWLEPDLSV